MTVAIYARLSPKPNGDYEGVPAQIKRGKEYAAKMWPGETVEIFADEGITGASAEKGIDRPGFAQLRERVDAGAITHLWAVEQSRLTRGKMEWFEFAADLEDAGITELHTSRDGIIRIDEIADIRAVLNARERKVIIKRVNDRLAEKAANGEPPGVKPFGYVHGYLANGQHLDSRCAGPTCSGCKTKTYDVVPEQAAVIQYAAAKALSGWSLASIAAEMNKPADERDPELVPSSGDYATAWKDGVLGVHGGRITPGAVKNWLTVPTIAGLRQHSGEVIGSGNWPAILDEATHRTLKARLTGQRQVKRTGGGTYDIGAAHTGFKGRKYLLTGGLAVCGYDHEDGGTCGVPLTGMPIRLRLRKGETTPRVKPYLMCHPKNGGKGHLGIMLAEVEEHVVSEMFNHLDSPAFLDALGVDDETDEEREMLITALSEIEEQKRELATMWGQRRVTTMEWSTAKAALEDREHEMSTTLASIPATSGRVDLSTAREDWEEMTLDEQREFLRDHIEKVTIHPATKTGPVGLDTDRVTIDWRWTS